MHTLFLYRLMPCLFLLCLGIADHPRTQQDVEVWTVSGLPAHVTLRHYIGLSGQKGSETPQVVELHNDALQLDKAIPERDRNPRLEAAILSPDSHYLLCHWIGIWANTGVHSALCVYDVRDGRLLLNWLPPSHEFYMDCDWLNADEIWCSTPTKDKF